jgi:hypothetical protein
MSFDCINNPVLVATAPWQMPLPGAATLLGTVVDKTVLVVVAVGPVVVVIASLLDQHEVAKTTSVAHLAPTMTHLVARSNLDYRCASSKVTIPASASTYLMRPSSPTHVSQL